MNVKYYIVCFFILSGNLFISNILNSQGLLIPKIGFEQIVSSPVIRKVVQVNGKSGFIVGAEYRVGNSKVYFVPSFLISNNIADIMRIDTSSQATELELIESINMAYLNVNAIMGVELLRFNVHSRMSLRTGLTMAYNVKSSDWESYGLPQDAHRKYNWKYLMGLGFEFNSAVLDIDYNLSYLREFRSSNLVRNGVSITVGYRL